MRIVKSALIVGILGPLALTQGGCLVAAAAAGTGAGVAYVRGDTEASLDADPERVTAAAKAAFEEMKLSVISSEASSIDGQVLARTAQDVKVRVVAKSETAKTSRVSVRVGNFGDSALQGNILDRIKAKLAADALAGAADD